MTVLSIDFLYGGVGFFGTQSIPPLWEVLRGEDASVAFNIAIVRFDFTGRGGVMTFCSLLPSHHFPLCSTLCPSTFISLKHLNFKVFPFNVLPWSEKRF